MESDLNSIWSPALTLNTNTDPCLELRFLPTLLVVERETNVINSGHAVLSIVDVVFLNGNCKFGQFYNQCLIIDSHWLKASLQKNLTLSRVRHGSNSSMLKFPLSCSSSKSYCPCAKAPKTTPTFRPTLSTPGDKKTVRHSTLRFQQSLLYTGTHVPLGIIESCLCVLNLPISIRRAAACSWLSKKWHWIVYV